MQQDQNPAAGIQLFTARASPELGALFHHSCQISAFPPTLPGHKFHSRSPTPGAAYSNGVCLCFNGVKSTAATFTLCQWEPFPSRSCLQLHAAQNICRTCSANTTGGSSCHWQQCVMSLGKKASRGAGWTNRQL